MSAGETGSRTPSDDPPSATEEIARLRLELSDQSLQQLEEDGVVKWDREKHVVRKGPAFEETFAEIRPAE